MQPENSAFISDEYGVHVSREEMMYLAIHIRRVFKQSSENADTDERVEEEI